VDRFTSNNQTHRQTDGQKDYCFSRVAFTNEKVVAALRGVASKSVCNLPLQHDIFPANVFAIGQEISAIALSVDK